MNSVRIVSPLIATILAAVLSGCAPAPGTPQTVPASPTAAQVARQVQTAPTPDATAQEEAASSAPLATLPTPDATAQEEAAIVGGSHGAPPPAVATLQDEIFLAGAPAFAIMFLCDRQGADTLPAVTWQQEGTVGQLCLYGFADGAEVQYEVVDAEGAAVVTGTSMAATLDGPQPAASVLLNVEFFAAGEWSIVARSPGAELRETFDVAAPEGPARVAMRLLAGEATVTAGRGLYDLRSGDEVFVEAVHLPPDVEIPVGVYYAPEENYAGSDLSLHEQASMPTDEGGTLSVRLELDPSYVAGFYCVVIAAAEGYVPEHGSGVGGATECFTVITN